MVHSIKWNPKQRNTHLKLVEHTLKRKTQNQTNYPWYIATIRVKTKRLVTIGTRNHLHSPMWDSTHACRTHSYNPQFKASQFPPCKPLMSFQGSQYTTMPTSHTTLSSWFWNQFSQSAKVLATSLLYLKRTNHKWNSF